MRSIRLARRAGFVCLLAFLALAIAPARADAVPVTINFDTFDDLDDLSTLGSIGGAVFTNAVVLEAGSSLNEFDFPPNSNPKVAVDQGGAMRIAFSGLVSSFSVFITYSTPVTLQAFDAANNPLGSDTSAFGNNLGTVGDPGSSPNELFSVAFANIKSVVITGDVAGSSFVVDDIQFDIAQAPEPATLLLLGVGAATMLRRRMRRKV